MDPVLVFHHIPKCYGTSLRKYFRSFLTPHADYIATYENPKDFLENPFDLATLSSEDFLLGHFYGKGQSIVDRYPDLIGNPRFKLFTFLRDPLEMQISLFYYSLKNNLKSVKKNPDRFESLESHLRTTHNAMSHALPCNHANYRDVLDRYFFVGVTEQLDLSMRVLLERIREIYKTAPRSRSVVRVLRGLEKLEPENVPHQNKSARDGQDRAISEETLEIFRERNALDYALYDYALARLASPAGADA